MLPPTKIIRKCIKRPQTDYLNCYYSIDRSWKFALGFCSSVSHGEEAGRTEYPAFKTFSPFRFCAGSLKRGVMQDLIALEDTALNLNV